MDDYSMVYLLDENPPHSELRAIPLYEHLLTEVLPLISD